MQPEDRSPPRGRRALHAARSPRGGSRRRRSRNAVGIALTAVVLVALVTVVVSRRAKPIAPDGTPIATDGSGGGSGVSKRPPEQPVVHPPAGVLGFYSGYDNQSGVQAMAATLKTPVAQAMDFFDGSSWATIENSPAKVVPSWNQTGYQMTWAIPILPGSGGSLREGSTGAYNKYFAAIATYLVSHGQASSIIRLGWEFNGYWFTWSADSCQACFVGYWRQIVNTMRSVPGEAFRFEWNPVAGLMQFPIEAAYPGNAWVDIIGLDIYDEVYHDKDGPTRWNDLLVEDLGLDWLAGFAAAHHKPMALPEWGLGFPPAGGGDNPYYISQMAQFIATHDVVSAIYWDYGTSKLDQSPRSLRAFVAAFG